MQSPSEQIIDQCIDQIRAGRKTLSECLQEYPEYRHELKSLARLVLSIRPPDVAPDPHRKMLARHAFVETLAREKRKAHTGWFPFHFGTQPIRLAASAFNILAVLVITTSAVATAKEAQPGDLLYGLKTGIEQVQVVAALTPETKAQLHLEHARERLYELQRALASDRPTVADSVAPAYAATMVQAQRDIESVRAAGAPVESLHRSLQENLSRQQEVLAQAAEKGATGTENAIREVQELVPASPNISGAVTRALAATSPRSAAPVPGSASVAHASGESVGPGVSSSTSAEDAQRHIIQLADVARPTSTSTVLPTATTPPATATATASPTGVTSEPLMALSMPTVTPTEAPPTATHVLEMWTRTPYATMTPRATMTPSVTISPTPGTVTPQATGTLAAEQTAEAEEARQPRTPMLGGASAPGNPGGGVNVAIRTATPTFGPTQVPTQVRSRATSGVRSSSPGESGFSTKPKDGPAR